MSNVKFKIEKNILKKHFFCMDSYDNDVVAGKSDTPVDNEMVIIQLDQVTFKQPFFTCNLTH